jgi:alkanesulfonate monooxygenase SsuD/methylene tetrahydromethanopterin reductase-like flavin-dependent oxidoreductase (luciferase family)
MPKLSDEPELIKFSRVDVVSYEGDWDPEDYDPLNAKATMEDHIEEAVEAEALGWDGYLHTEHHFDGWTLVPSPNLFLTAVAMRTSKIRLGHALQVLPVHNPYTLAEEYGMLDVLSGGRLEVGLGRGNFEFEWDRYEGDRADAVELFDDNLDHLSKALTESGFTHDGVHPMPEPSTVYPRPMQDPLPIWRAATSPESVKKVGQAGHNLLGMPNLDGGKTLKTYVDAAAEVGLSRSGANFGMLTKVICAPTDQEAEALDAQLLETIGGHPGPVDTRGQQSVVGFASGGIIGSPETVLDQLKELIDGTGARRLILILRLLGISGETSRQTQRLLAEEVFPHLRHYGASSVMDAVQSVGLK